MLTQNIILYGPRCCGKSTVSKALAENIGYQFIDLDQEIEKEVDQSINTYVVEQGRDAFRKTEHTCCQEVLARPGKKIIALGGGTIMFPNNQQAIHAHNHCCIFLDTDLNILIKRITADQQAGKQRPALDEQQDSISEYKHMYHKRIATYKANADYSATNNGSIDSCVQLLMEKVCTGGICVPICNFSPPALAKTYTEIQEDRRVKYIELRIDHMSNPNRLNSIIQQAPRPCIVTNRSQNEGGNYTGSIDDSLSILTQAAQWGAAYIDLELTALDKEHSGQLKEIQQRSGLILSYHNFQHVDSIEKLQDSIDQMSTHNPDVFKIACMPQTPNEVQQIYQLQDYIQKHYPTKDYVLIAMGALGQQTRIDIPKSGGLLTFASLDGNTSAPGQISVDTMYPLLYAN